MRPRPKAAEAIILPDSSMQLSLSRYPSCPSSTWPTARRLGLHRHYPTAPPQFLNAKGYLLCWIGSACYAGSRSPKGLRCSRQGHPAFGCPDGSQEHLRWQNPAATSPQIYGGTWGIPVQSYRKPQGKNPEKAGSAPRGPHGKASSLEPLPRAHLKKRQDEVFGCWWQAAWSSPCRVLSEL